MNKEQTGGSVFRNQNFRLGFFGALVSELGAVLYSFAVSFYILEISGNDAFLQGLYLALCGAVLLLMTPLGGVLGDRWNKVKIMVACDYAKGGLILLATLLMLLFRQPRAHIAVLFAVGVLGSAVSGIFSPAAGSLMPHIVEDEKLQQANAWYSVKSSLQSIFGVVLAGVLYAALPITRLFLIVGVCYVLSGVSEMFIRYEHRPSAERMSVRLVLSDMREGLGYLRTQKAIMALMTAILFINFFFSPIGGNFIPFFIKTDVALAPGYLFDELLTPELWSSVFSMLIGLSSLVGSVILSARKPKEKCGRSTAIRLCVISVVMVALTLGYWLLVDRGLSLNAFLLLFSLGCLLIGFSIVFINIPVNTALMRAVDRDKLSKVTSFISMISQGLIPIASVLAGLVLRFLGSTPLLIGCTAGFAAAALFLLFNREAREI
ncbi:MAG: MFS transporter [Oscillospiraceae bacterium]|nr:MFS transporter [Oscillospiraceae bacterium]